MKTIYKYEIKASDEDTLLPDNAQILSVGIQEGKIYLWAVISTTVELRPRAIRVYGTGHRVPAYPGIFLGTVHMVEDGLVFHIFEEQA